MTLFKKNTYFKKVLLSKCLTATGNSTYKLAAVDTINELTCFYEETIQNANS
jgi:hypothetical protein